MTYPRATLSTSGGALAVAPSPRERLLADYLTALNALTLELDAAISAISRNALPDLQESIRRQEVLCGDISTLAASLTVSPAFNKDVSKSTLAQIAGWERRILNAAHALRSANQRYNALIRHCRRSIDMFSSLCRSYSGQVYQDDAGREAGEHCFDPLSRPHPGSNLRDDQLLMKEACRTGSDHRTLYCEM